MTEITLIFSDDEKYERDLGAFCEAEGQPESGMTPDEFINFKMKEYFNNVSRSHRLRKAQVEAMETVAE